MRGALIACVAMVCAAGAEVAVAAGPAPRAALQDPVCRQAPNPLSRAIATTAVMRPLADTTRMELQFNLLEKRSGASSYTAVTGGDLGKWVAPPNRTLGSRAKDVWKRQKPVVDLAAPAVYRFHVGFRWTGAHGRSLGVQYQWGTTCTQR